MTATISENIEHLRQAREFVNERAAALDDGETSTREIVDHLGSLGLFELDCRGRSLADTVTVIESVAAESLSAGFTAWAHRMALEYLARGSVACRGKYGSALESGERIGVTAMASGLKYVAGLGEIPLVATEVEGGIEVSGPIPWASNLYDDALIVFPARSAEGARTYVGIVEAGAPGVTIRPAPTLLALNSTASTSLRFDSVFVPEENLLGTDLTSFVTDVRPRFLLLQTAFCSGIAGTSLTASAEHLTGLGEGFADEHAMLGSEYHSLRERLYRFAETPDAAPADYIQLRLDGSRLAMAATRLEVTLRGGAGYATKSATNRRFREAAFLPVQSPSEGQLRWELEHSG